MLTRFPRFLAVAAFTVLATAFPAAAHHPADEQATAAAAVGAAEVTLTGTVDELVVVDQVNSTTQRYAILRQSDGKRFALRGDAIQTIEAGAQVGVTGSQTGTMFTVNRVDTIKAGTKTATVGTSQVSGQFMVAHADNFETGTSQFFYNVFDAQNSAIDVAMPFLPGSLATGMQVVVEGTLAAGGASIVPDRITIQFIPAAPLAAVSTSYLVIPIKFPTNAVANPSPPYWNYNADPFTPAALNTAVFGTLPTKSAAEYYKEASFGQQLLTGVTANNGSGGFLQADIAAPAACNYTAVGNAAEAAAVKAGYVLANYTGILYVFNGVPGCGWAGLAYVGWARAWSNNTTALWVIGHELGHNFGLLHAGSLACTGAAIGCGAAGSVSEYGDPFNTMGNSGNTGHFDATQKEILGWITPGQVKTHAGGTATYTLSPIETGGLPTYAVKIPTSNANRTYWLEYRQPVGTFDAFITPGAGYPNNGAQVRVEYPFEKSSGSDDTEILDMTPATAGNFHDAALLVGAAPFIDAETGVTISVLSATLGASGQLTVQVATSAGAPTTTTMVSSLNPSTAGASITFTATVTGTAPTGTVNFADGGTSISGCSAVALTGAGNARTAACAIATLTAGTHSIVATYSGDASNGASASAALSQVVNKKATTTTQVSSLNPSTAGASVTFTATVTGTAPTGTVNFTDGGTSISGCSAVALTGAGNVRTAACATTALVAGTRSIVSAYAGDATNLASTSTTLSQVVNKHATTTTLVSSLNPSAPGASVTFTATVTGAAPTGTVNFTDGGTSIAGCTAVALTGAGNARTAACTTTALVAGTRSIVSAYAGDASNIASTSTTLSQVVNMNATTTTQVSSLNPSTAGASVTFTATVTGAAPTGTVNFTDGGTSIAGCTAVALTGAGNARTAACTTTALVVGTRSIVSAYAGDAGNLASTSTTLSQVVSKKATTTTQVSSLNPSTAGASVTFTATVTGAAPTGTVNFTDGGKSISGCSAVAFTGAGNARTAACATSIPTAGAHSIVASYSGDANNSSSASAALPQVVNKAATATTQVSSLNPSTAGASVTFTATVAGAAPTGTVNFTDGGVSIAGCSAVALAGSGNARTAACSTPALTAATHGIVAAYAGDAGNLASTSTTLSQVVSAGGGTSINIALAANGGVASASSIYSGLYPVAAVNNGDRAGLNWGNGGGWKDGTASAYPDWVQITFNGQKTIDHIIVYTLQDNYLSPVDPSSAMTFTLYGLTDFQVQGWNGSAWVTVGTVAGNNLVKRQVNFSAMTTDRIRINVTGGLGGYSRITEIEAWTPVGAGPVATTTTTALVSSANPSTAGASVTFTATVAGAAPTGTVNFTDGGVSIAGCSAVALAGSGNARTAACSTPALTAATHGIVAAYAGDAGNLASTSTTLSQVVSAGGGTSINIALAANGGVASASSIYSGLYPVAAVNNGDRAGLNWGNGGGWKDGTASAYPDWVQITFNGQKTIDHIIVYTLQDNYLSPVDPSSAMTFTLYGLTDFQVQGWNGSAWVTVGTVAGNNLVKRQVNFSAMTTDRIRINVTGGLGGYSRITEIEAWGN